MNCNCQELPSLVDIDEYKDFLVGKNIVESGDWKEIYRCTDCGTKWVVDVPDKFQKSYAIRGDNWKEVEEQTKELIKERIINNRGGFEEDLCVWAGCQNKRLKGRVMCVEHLYEAGHRS